jgi:hypothetical protein
MPGLRRDAEGMMEHLGTLESRSTHPKLLPRPALFRKLERVSNTIAGSKMRVAIAAALLALAASASAQSVFIASVVDLKTPLPAGVAGKPEVRRPGSTGRLRAAAATAQPSPAQPRHRPVTAPAPRTQTRAGQPLRALDHRGAEPERDHWHHQLHLGARLQCAAPRAGPAAPHFRALTALPCPAPLPRSARARGPALPRQVRARRVHARRQPRQRRGHPHVREQPGGPRDRHARRPGQ